MQVPSFPRLRRSPSLQLGGRPAAQACRLLLLDKSFDLVSLPAPPPPHDRPLLRGSMVCIRWQGVCRGQLGGAALWSRIYWYIWPHGRFHKLGAHLLSVL